MSYIILFYLRKFKSIILQHDTISDLNYNLFTFHIKFDSIF